MEITLEKIELVKDRTGVTYAEAKQALEETDGSVVDAIIAIEEIINTGEKKKGFGKKGEALFSRLKDIVKKGNVSKIQVKKDGELVLNVPVNAGLVGVVIAPIAAVVAVVAAFGFKCSIEIIKTYIVLGFLYKLSSPGIFYVVLEFHTKRTVVPRIGKPTVNF